MFAYSIRRFPILLSLLAILVLMMSSTPAAAQQEPPATPATPPAGLPLTDRGRARPWVSRITPVQPPVRGSSDASPVAPPRASAPAGTIYSYRSLTETIALGADGRGDVVLESRLLDGDITDWTTMGWCFGWAPDAYSAISAWDDEGPLTFATSFDGTWFCVDVDFRQAIQPGDSYHYSLAITIAGIASPSGSLWQAAWVGGAGAAIEQFILGVTLPANAVIRSVSPTPTTRLPLYVEWQETNKPPEWISIVSITYTLPSVFLPLIMR